MPEKYSGHALSEYGIILALIGVLAIPALMFLGGANQDAITNTGGMLSNDPNLALISPKSGSGNPGSSPGNSPASPPASTKNTVINFDPATGQITFNGATATGSGSATTSAEGTSLLADNLQNLVNTSALNGKSSSSQVKSMILNLADLGHQIAAQESQSITSKFDSGSMHSLDDLVYQFSVYYNDISPFLNDPQFKNLKATVYNNASMIYQLSQQNFLQQYSPGSSALKALSIGQGVFNQPAGPIAVTVNQTPTVTNTASTIIQGTTTLPSP